MVVASAQVVAVVFVVLLLSSLVGCFLAAWLDRH